MVAIHFVNVLSSALGRRWRASEMPVGINPKTQEAVYRAIGRGGIVIVGEGARGRLTRLVNEERGKAQRVASGVPVTVLYVGHGEDEVPIGKLAPAIKSLPKKIDRATMAAVIKRMDSVSQTVASLPIPTIGNANILIGFGIMMIGFLMTTRWR